MSESKNPEQRNLEKEYEEYVKMITPTHNLYLQMLKAFIVGGMICEIGEEWIKTWPEASAPLSLYLSAFF